MIAFACAFEQQELLLLEYKALFLLLGLLAGGWVGGWVATDANAKRNRAANCLSEVVDHVVLRKGGDLTTWGRS